MERLLSVSLVLALVLSLLGCGGSEQDELVVYNGRNEALVDSLVQQFEQKTDIPVSVRYGTDAQLLAALKEEGDQSPADVFWANTTGALTQARTADMLTELPDSLLSVPGSFVPEGGMWAPVTARFRVLAYNSDRVDPEDLPDSVLDLPTLDRFEGRVGWTPPYSSFQDFVTAMRVLHGPDTTRAWLNEMEALNPNAYSSNTPMIRALAAGEIDIGLTNHYYVLRLKHGGAEGEYEEEEEGEEHEEEEEESGPSPNAPVEIYHFEDGDVGNLALVAGVGHLATSDQPEKARRFIRFLWSNTPQRLAATQVNEYPVVEDVQVPDYMTPVGEMLPLSPTFDFERLSNLDATLKLLRSEGIL